MVSPRPVCNTVAHKTSFQPKLNQRSNMRRTQEENWWIYLAWTEKGGATGRTAWRFHNKIKRQFSQSLKKKHKFLKKKKSVRVCSFKNTVCIISHLVENVSIYEACSHFALRRWHLGYREKWQLDNMTENTRQIGQQSEMDRFSI